MRAASFVESYITAWNHRDPVAVADHLAENGIYCDIPENAKRTHDELIVYLKGFFARYRHRYELIGDIVASETSVAFQYRMCPRNKTSDGLNDVPIQGAEFVTLIGDSATTITDYYEIAGRSGKRRQQAGEQPGKYAKSGLKNEDLLDYKRRLEKTMVSRQLFLRPDLTLPGLAEAIGCTANHLSQVINAGFGMSFFDYLNQYRVEHARELMSTLNDRDSTILNVAYAVGFNSNSAFYAAFKKSVGQTPAEFRRAALARKRPPR